MALKNSELYSYLWQSCDALRGGMDAEIAALESKLTKARSIKQVMMQALLSGRIRLT